MHCEVGMTGLFFFFFPLCTHAQLDEMHSSYLLCRSESIVQLLCMRVSLQGLRTAHARGGRFGAQARSVQ